MTEIIKIPVMECKLHRFRRIIIDEYLLEWRPGKRHYGYSGVIWLEDGSQAWLIVLNERLPKWIKIITLIHEMCHVLTLQNKRWGRFIDMVDPEWMYSHIVKIMRRCICRK